MNIINRALTRFGFRIYRTRRSGKSRYSRFEAYHRLFLGKTLYVHDQESFDLGYYELFIQEMYLFKATSEKPYIIDCGANMGMSILYFKKLYPQAEILAFEADPHVFSFLEKNMRSFAHSDVHLVNKAVWDGSAVTRPFLSEGGAGGRVQDRTASHEFIDVPTVRLKDYLNRRIDLLKFDIEGAEYRVIRDCANELKLAENIFIEYHSFPEAPQELHKILEIVQNAGFRYQIKDAFASHHPFKERQFNFGMDLQLNIFCYKN